MQTEQDALTLRNLHQGIVFYWLISYVLEGKKIIIFRSSFEEKYRALESSTCELICLLYILRDIHITCYKPPVLYCDNQSALHIASNSIFHEKIQHLKTDCHQVREKVQQIMLKLLPISFQEELTNFLTKSFSHK